MFLARQFAGLVIGLPALVCAGVLSGCGGKAGYPGTGTPVTVSLAVSQVVVAQNGKPTGVVVTIQSTSETALVTAGGLPAGVHMSYAASDTNPSGLLTFTANSSSPLGVSMPTLTVVSAGQTVTLQFSLKVVTA
jgi:hypothetical protein